MGRVFARKCCSRGCSGGVGSGSDGLEEGTGVGEEGKSGGGAAGFVWLRGCRAGRGKRRASRRGREGRWTAAACRQRHAGCLGQLGRRRCAGGMVSRCVRTGACLGCVALLAAQVFSRPETGMGLGTWALWDFLVFWNFRVTEVGPKFRFGIPKRLPSDFLFHLSIDFF